MTACWAHVLAMIAASWIRARILTHPNPTGVEEAKMPAPREEENAAKRKKQAACQSAVAVVATDLMVSVCAGPEEQGKGTQGL